MEGQHTTPFSLGKALSKLGAAGSSTAGPCCGMIGTSSHLLESLPPPARSLVWEQLTSADKRVVRCVSRPVCSCYNGAVSQVTVGGRHASFSPADMRHLGSTFPELNQLTLQLGPDASDSTAALLQELRKVRLPHLHTFSCDVKLKGDCLLAVARFLVHTPSLRVLALPNQRGCSPADQRLLCAVLEALPHLTHLDLGGAGSSRTGSNAISPSLMRRITKLLPRLQQLSCNAACVPDEQLESLGQLPQLQSLSIAAAGSGHGLAAALRRCSHVTSLELQHASLGAGLAGCLAGMAGLQVLTLGLCPQLTDNIMDEVSGLQHLHKLSLPFPVTSSHLQRLCKLPALGELLSFNQLELDVLGPAHDPLAHVSKLVASSIDSHGKGLASVFPAVASVYLRSCGDMEALSLRSCGSWLQQLVAGDCGGLTDEGFAGLRVLRGLNRLQVDNAHQLTDTSFVAMFSSTMPALHTIGLGGATRISDTSLQLLTASCRRLSSISISACPQLTDKTLKRLAHCEHLSTVSIKGCRGITSEGVAALVAAPQVKAVVVAACPGVRRSALAACRQGGKLRLVSDSERRTSDSSSGRRVSDSGSNRGR